MIIALIITHTNANDNKDPRDKGVPGGCTWGAQGLYGIWCRMYATNFQMFTRDIRVTTVLKSTVTVAE